MRSMMTAMNTMEIPASKPLPTSILPIASRTSIPRPLAPIIDPITTMESAIIVVWLIPTIIDGLASGSWTSKSICFFVAPNALAASDSPVSSVSLMIKSDFSGNYTEIRTESKRLTDFEKLSLLSMHEKSPTLPFVVNLVVGAGIGSFIQGDIRGGLTALITEAVGLGIYMTGVAGALLEPIATNENFKGTGATLMTIGIATMLGGKIYESIRPFTYSKKYNDRLHSALSAKADIFVTPVVTAVNNKVILGMVGKISF